MSIQRIATIFLKDLRDATRDARVLVALLIPIGFGLFYSLTFDDEDTQVTADVAYVSADETTLPNDLTAIAGDVIEIRFARFESAEQVRAQVAKRDADLGLIVPAGFDIAVQSGEQPAIEVVRRGDPTFGGDYVTAAIEPALRLMAGQQPPATLQVTDAAVATESETALDKLGLEKWSIASSIVMMIALISMLAVPIILAEEGEKKTLDALILVSNYAEVVIAKASVGIFYIAVMVPLLLVLTGIRPTRALLFTGAVFTLAIALLGLGLLMAGLFKSANQLNTWSGILLLPVIMPALAMGVPAPRPVEIVAQALPSGAAARLLMNSLADERVFSGQLLAFATIIAWAVLAYLLLLWQLSRRQA